MTTFAPFPRHHELSSPAAVIDAGYLVAILMAAYLILGLTFTTLLLRRPIYKFFGKVITLVCTVFVIAFTEDVLLNVAFTLGLGYIGINDPSSSQLAHILTFAPLGIFWYTLLALLRTLSASRKTPAASAPTHDAATVDELLALLCQAESDTRMYRQRFIRYKDCNQELLKLVDSLRATVARKVKCVGQLSFALKCSENARLALVQQVKVLGDKDMRTIVSLRKVTEDLKAELAAMRSLAADKETEMEAIKAARDEARAKRREAVVLLKAVNLRIRQLEATVSTQQVSLDAVTEKSVQQESIIEKQEDKIATQEVIIQGLETSHKEVVLQSAEQGKTIEELTVKVKTLEEQLANVQQPMESQELATQAISEEAAQPTTTQLPSQSTTAPSTTSSPLLAPHSQLQGAELDAARREIVDLKCEVARCTETNAGLVDELHTKEADWMAREQELLARERAMQEEIARLRLIVQRAGLSTATSSDSVVTIVAENVCLSESPESGKDVFSAAESTSTTTPSTPRLPSANTIKSGLALASDSLSNIVTSSSSKLLSKVDLDLPPATPVPSPRMSARRQTEPESPSLPMIIVSSSSEQLCRQDLADLPPASPWSTPLKSRSDSQQVDSPMNMIASSSSQLICGQDLESLPPASPWSTPIKSRSSCQQLEVSPTNMVASSSSQLLCHEVLDLPSLSPLSTPVRPSRRLEAPSPSPMGMVASSSSQLLCRQDLDLPVASPWSTPLRPASRPQVESPTNMIASSSSQLVCRQDLDLPPASPWSTPLKPQSSCQQLEASPMNMVASSSSQLLCQQVLDLPSLSPLSTPARPSRHLEVPSPTNMVASSSSQLLCRDVLDLPTPSPPSTPARPGRHLEALSPTPNMVASSSSQLLCRQTLDSLPSMTLSP